MKLTTALIGMLSVYPIAYGQFPERASVGAGATTANSLASIPNNMCFTLSSIYDFRICWTRRYSTHAGLS